MKVTFVGLGSIGAPMAGRLADHFGAASPITVWNRTPARAEAFAASHECRVAGSFREAVANADVVVTCLSTSYNVEVLLEQDGVEAFALKPGSMLLDCTSGEPDVSRRIAERLQSNGIGFADCPVSGGVAAAVAGTLTVMVGCHDADFTRARPILEIFAKRIERVGPVGAGHAMKSINNALAAVSIIAFAEGIAALAKFGVPVSTALEVINSSSGRSFFSEVLAPQIVSGRRAPTFRLALMEKDVGIATTLMKEVDVDGAVIPQVANILSGIRADIGEDADYLELIERVERQSGVSIRS